MVRKLLSIILALTVILFALTSCKDKDDNSKTDETNPSVEDGKGGNNSTTDLPIDEFD